MAALESQHGPQPPGVWDGAFLVWRRERERGHDTEQAVREAMPALMAAAASPAIAEPTVGRRETARVRTGELSPIDRAQAAALAEHAARMAEGDEALQGSGRAWRGFPIKRVSRGTDWAGPWEEVEVEGPWSGPERIRLRRDPVCIEPHDERPRTPGVAPGTPVGSLIMAARRLGIVFNWSEAEGVHFLMTGQIPRPKPLVARRMVGVAGRTGAAVLILAAAHVNPDTVRTLFAREQSALIGRDRRRGGRDVEESNLELVRYIEAWHSSGRALDFDRLRAAWNRRWKRTRPQWVYRYSSWMRRDYIRTAKALLGRALKPSGKVK